MKRVRIVTAQTHHFLQLSELEGRQRGLQAGAVGPTAPSVLASLQHATNEMKTTTCQSSLEDLGENYNQKYTRSVSLPLRDGPHVPGELSPEPACSCSRATPW